MAIIEPIKLSTNWGETQLALNTNFHTLNTGKVDTQEGHRLISMAELVEINRKLSELEATSGTQSSLIETDPVSKAFIQGKDVYTQELLEKAKNSIICVILDHVPIDTETTYSITVGGVVYTYEYYIGQLVRASDSTNLNNPLPFYRVKNIIGTGVNKTIIWVPAEGGSSTGGGEPSSVGKFKWFELMNPKDIIRVSSVGFSVSSYRIEIEKGAVVMGSLDLNPLVVVVPATATDQEVRFLTDNPLVSIEGGIIKALPSEDITFNVTVKTVDGNKVATLPITTVNVIPVASVEITGKFTSFLVGESKVIAAKVLPANATDTTFTVGFQGGSLTDVASITPDPITAGSYTILALKNGRTKIVAKSNRTPTIKDEFELSVNTDVASVKFTTLPINAIASDIGKTIQTQVSILPSTANINTTLDYVSTKPAVATVSPTGLITLVGGGDATVVVSNGIKTDILPVSIGTPGGEHTG